MRDDLALHEEGRREIEGFAAVDLTHASYAVVWMVAKTLASATLVEEARHAKS